MDFRSISRIRLMFVDADGDPTGTSTILGKLLSYIPVIRATIVGEDGLPKLLKDATGNLPSIPQTYTEYDVLLVAGQSNSTTSGGAKDALLDYEDPRMLCFPRGNKPYSNKFILAKDPIPNGNGEVEAGNENNISFATHFGHYYLAENPTRRLCILPFGIGNTGFSNNRWRPGDDLYNNAITHTNTFLSSNPGSKVIGILWHQGERDHDNGVSVSDQQNYLNSLVDGFRSSITGCETVPFICGGLSGDWLPGDLLKSLYNQMFADLPKRRSYTGFASSSGLPGSGVGNEIHFNAIALRIFGKRYFDAWKIAKNYVIGIPSKATGLQVFGYSSSAIRVDWVQSGVYDSFTLLYRISGRSAWEEKSAVTTQRYLLTGLALNTEYEIAIKTINNSGSVISDTAIASTSATLTTLPAADIFLEFEATDLTTNFGNYGFLSSTGSFESYTDSTRGKVLKLNDGGALIAYRNIPQNYTRSAWVKLLEYRSFAAIFGAENGNSSGRHDLIINGLSGIQLWSNYNYVGTSDDTLPVNSWVHIAVTYNSVSAIAKIFQNGIKVKELSGVTHTPDNSNNQFFIGLTTFGSASWNNLLDSVATYNQVLSEQQIAKLYEETLI